MKVNEKNLPTQQYSPQTDPRISGPHEHSSRSGRDQKTPGQGTQTPQRDDTPQTRPVADAAAVSYTLPKSARVLVRREFLVLQRKGRRRHTPHFVVITLPRHNGRSRLGITATPSLWQCSTPELDKKTAARVLSSPPGKNRSDSGRTDHPQGWCRYALF